MSLAIYSKVHPRSQHESLSWVPQVLNTLAVQRTGVWASQTAASFCTRSAPVMDVRYQAPWKSSTGEFNIPGQLTPTWASWSPIWGQQAGSFRPPEKAKLDASKVNPEPMAWLKATLNLTDQAINTAWNSGQSATIYTQTFPRVAPERVGWVTAQALANIPSRAGIFSSQAASFRTPDWAKLDPRLLRFEQEIAYIQQLIGPQVGPTVSQFIPAVTSWQASFRTLAGSVLDVRNLQLKDRKFGIPFDPALLQGAFTQTSQAASYRTPDLNRLMTVLTRYDQDAWFLRSILQNPVAQQAPAMAQLVQSYRTKEGATLDVRYSPSLPTTGWEGAQITPNLQIWSPAFAQLLSSYRALSGKTLDVRGIYYDELAWLKATLGLVDAPPKKKTDHRLLTIGVGH